MKIKIEHGLPIPHKQGGRRLEVIELLRGMKVGDSFVFDGKSISNIYVYSKIAGIEITVRKVGENHHRVWRVK